MKKLILSIAVVGLFSLSSSAQIETPAPSPLAELEQRVGLTDIEVEYSRPGMKGREIYGGLVPYGEVWRTGANARTQISFSEDVVIEGEDLEAGEYSLFTIPGEDEWTIIFNEETSGSPSDYDDSKDALRVNVNPQDIDPAVETFTINVQNIRNSSATLDLVWENTHVIVPITFHTDKQVEASIDETMSGPGGGEYYAAARYYFEEDKDLDQALEWMDKAIEMEGEKFWMLYQQSLMQAESGDKKGALKTAKRSKKLAKEAGYDNYVNMNDENIKKWSK